MSYLANKRCYLASPIEFTSANENWRPEIIETLRSRFQLDVFDPFSDPKQNWVPDIIAARQAQDHQTIKNIAKKFVRKDLGLVDRSDVVIAYLPYKVPTTGTHHEIIFSNESKKPTLLVVDDRDISYLPIWYFGFIPLEFMFPNWQALFNYLDEVNQGLHKSNDRWDFVYGNL